jgi:hypothetical protein
LSELSHRKKLFQINEPEDSYSWFDNYLCAESDIGMKWSTAGAIADMDCTITLNEDPHGGWLDNFLCLPKDSVYTLFWTSTGAIAGHWKCVKWFELQDPESWSDNYMCFDPKNITTYYTTTIVPIGLGWSSAGPIPAMFCTQVSTTM